MIYKFTIFSKEKVYPFNQILGKRFLKEYTTYRMINEEFDTIDYDIFEDGKQYTIYTRANDREIILGCIIDDL